MPGKINSLDTDYIVKEYTTGRSVKDIGRELGVSDYPIRRILLNCGIRIRDRMEQLRLERERITTDIVARYNAGESSVSIAKDLKMSTANVCDILEKNGINRRGNISDISEDIAVELYKQLQSCSKVAKKLGVTHKVIKRILVNNGFTLGRSAFERRIVLPADKIIRMYRKGKSIVDIGTHFGCSESPVKRLLLEKGIEIRNLSEAMYVRMSHTTKEERKHITSAANKAATGRAKTWEEKCRAAKTREERRLNVSDNEIVLAKMLKDRGIIVSHQTAVGCYNCDLTIYPVAVEVFGGNWHWSGDHLARFEERFRYILNQGWSILSIAVSRRWPLTNAVADYLASEIKRISSNPPVVAEYRMIWGAGEFTTGGCANDNHLSIEPPFSTTRDRKTGQYKTVPR